MYVKDLTTDEIQELKCNMYTQRIYPEHPSYGELAMIDDLVSDDEVFEEYDWYDFFPEDFFCNCDRTD